MVLNRVKAQERMRELPASAQALHQRIVKGYRWLADNYASYMDSQDPKVIERWVNAADRVEGLEKTFRSIYNVAHCVHGPGARCNPSWPMCCSQCAGAKDSVQGALPLTTNPKAE